MIRPQNLKISASLDSNGIFNTSHKYVIRQAKETLGQNPFQPYTRAKQFSGAVLNLRGHHAPKATAEGAVRTFRFSF